MWCQASVPTELPCCPLSMELGVLSSEKISCRRLPCCQRSPHWALLGFSPLYFKASAVMPRHPFSLTASQCLFLLFPDFPLMPPSPEGRIGLARCTDLARSRKASSAPGPQPVALSPARVAPAMIRAAPFGPNSLAANSVISPLSTVLQLSTPGDKA